MVRERLDAGRRGLRGLGAAVAALAVVGFALFVYGLFRSVSAAPPAGWDAGALGLAARAPVAAAVLAVVLTCAAVAAAIATTWLPVPRTFVFDRANAYVVVGRHRSRHSLHEITLSSDPHTLNLGGRRYPIEPRDYERLTGFLRVVAPPNPNRKAVAAVKLTVIEGPAILRRLRAAAPPVRHPTHST